MSLFSKKNRSPFDPDRINWLFDGFEWLLANYGGYESFLKSYHLVLDSPNDFRLPPITHPEYVEMVFRSIMTHMGMGDWEVNLVPMSECGELDFEVDQR